MKNKHWAIFIGGLLFLMALPASAQTAILDNIANSYKSAAIGWASVMLGYANKLFSMLAAIEIAWCAIVWALTKSTIEDLMASLLQKIIGIGMFYAILLNGPTWIPAIINSFVDAGSNAAGVAGMSPSGIFSIGLVNAVTMLEGIKELSLFDQPLAVILSGLSAIVIVVSFTVIAGQLLVALVESYIVVSAGMLFLGFGGSRWTTDFVQKFIGYAMATGVKLMMLYLIIGIGTNEAVQWQTMLAAIKDPNADVFGTIFTVMGGSLLLVFLAFQIPALAGSMLAGSPSLTAGAATSTAAVTGAGIVGAGAGAAAAGVGAAKSVGGMASAGMAATREAQAQGLSGLAMAAGAGRNVLTSMGTVASQSAVQGISGTVGGQMAAVSEGRTAVLNERKAANAGPAGAGVPGAAAAGGGAGGSNGQNGGQVMPPSGEPPSGPGGNGGSGGSGSGGQGQPTARPQSAAAQPGQSGADAFTAMGGGSGTTNVMPPAPSGQEIGAGNSAGGTSAGNVRPPAASASTNAAETGNSAGSQNAGAPGMNNHAGNPADKMNQPVPPATAATKNPSGVQEQAKPSGKGLEGTLKDIQQVRPPQIPNDAAPQGTATIQMKHSE